MAIEISTLEQLQAMKDNLSADYVLVNDIDASDTAVWNDGAGFEPIGNVLNPFIGTFDGQKFVISNLFINRPETERVGMFGQMDGDVHRVYLIDVDITGSSRTGSLVGSTMGSVAQSYATGSVVSPNSFVGGLIGYISDGSVTMKSYANVNVAGNNDVGGLVGYGGGGNITESYATGQVTGSSRVGGLVGIHTNGVIQDTYAIGSVMGSGSYIGGLVGRNQATVNQSYWDTQTSGQGSSAAGTGLTTAEMQDPATFAAWDSDVWLLRDGHYPELRGFAPTPGPETRNFSPNRNPRLTLGRVSL